MSSSPTAAPTTAPELNQLGNLRYFGLILGGLVGFAIFYCGVWVYCHRQMGVIKVHQPLFLITICVGLFIWSMAVVPGSMDDEILSERGCDRACMATWWLNVLGYTIAFAALYAKLRRINKLFHTSSRCIRVKVEAADVMRPFLVLFTINFLLLLGWTLADPSHWNRDEPVDGSSIGYCTSDTTGNAFRVIISLVILVSLVLVCVQAWKARDIDVKFNESKYLAVGIYNWLQLSLVTVPAQIALGDDELSVVYLLNVSLLLMECFSMLLVLFVPIFMQVREYRRQQLRESNGPVAPSNLGRHVHVTGLTTLRNASTGAAITAITSNMTDEDQHADSTQVTALKNRISALEEDVKDLDEIKQELEKKCKGLQDMLPLDEESGERSEHMPGNGLSLRE